MDRRAFLKSGARWAGAGFLLPGAVPSLSSGGSTGAVDGGRPDLVLAKGHPKEATRKALEALGGMRRFMQPGQVVVLHPNASFDAPPDWGATTHPEVVAAVVEACLEAEARRILVVDHTLRPAEKCFARTGLADALASLPMTKLVSLDDRDVYRTIEVPRGSALKTVDVPVVLQKADLFINLPTAKSHSATVVSLGLKNLMGLIWDRHIFHNDIDLQQGVADLATVLRPHLTLLDAMRILKTGGPSGPGDVDPFGGVVAGVDPVAVDAYGVGLSSWNGQTLRPDQVGYIRHAVEHGVGTSELEKLRMLELT